MPSYLFEVTTATDTERYPFTLDDDRPLGPQVRQVLEELRLRGVVLKGGHSDELGVYWMGRELDASKRPGELEISPARPIELRMREGPLAAPPVDHTLPRGVLASALLGYAGGVIAWLLAGINAGPARFTADYNRLDQITMVLLGAIVGACVLLGVALRGRGVAPLAIVSGLVLGAVGSLAGGSAALLIPGAAGVRGFVVARVIGWALAAGIASLLLACYGRRFDWRRLGESLLLGLLGGAIAGVMFALPGPSDLWQGVAFATFGAAIGVAACGPALWHATAIIELDPKRGLVPEILTLREWPLHEASSVDLGALRLGCQDRRVALYPSAQGATFQGRRMNEPTFLDAGGHVAAGGLQYRIRLRQGDS